MQDHVINILALSSTIAFYTKWPMIAPTKLPCSADTSSSSVTCFAPPSTSLYSIIIYSIKFIVHIEPYSYDRPSCMNPRPAAILHPLVPFSPWGYTPFHNLSHSFPRPKPPVCPGLSSRECSPCVSGQDGWGLG